MDSLVNLFNMSIFPTTGYLGNSNEPNCVLRSENQNPINQLRRAKYEQGSSIIVEVFRIIQFQWRSLFIK